MTFAYLGQGVYLPSVSPKFYVINTKSDEYLIIDSSDSDYNEIITDILEITKGIKPRSLILTSCKKSSAGGASLISNFFNIPIIAHYPDTIEIRHGKCKNEEYSPCKISLELKDKVYNLESVQLINSKSPTLGSIIIKWKDFLFTGSNTLTAFGNDIKYVCNIIECKKV